MMCWSPRLLLPSLLAVSTLLLAQKPVINSNGVVNSASFAGTAKNEALVVGGAIFTIFGENLAASAQQATSTPLPTTLGGTSVTVGGIPAPLFYVSPRQINFQVPYAFNSLVPERVGQRVPVVVTNSLGSSNPVLAWVYWMAPSIFSQDGGGCGAGVIQNVSPDGTLSLNTPSNSASPGQFVVLYGTGLGPTFYPPADGEPAGPEPIARFHGSNFFAGIDGTFFLGSGTWWSGLVPGLVSVNQINWKLPEDAPEGCAVPLTVDSGVAPVTISIKKGGGPCRDAPPVTLASINWKKVITTSNQSPAGEVKARFSASFQTAPENLVRPIAANPPDPPSPVCRCTGFQIQRDLETYRCRNAGRTVLDAGPLTLHGVTGNPLELLPSPSTDGPTYTRSLPPGSLDAQTLRVSGTGGNAVGPFQTEVAIPAPIQVTTSVVPGTVIDLRRERPYTLAWSGGSPDTVVQMELRAYLTDRGLYSADEGIAGYSCTCQALATDGQLSLGLTNSPQNGQVVLQIAYPSENAELILTVTPRPTKRTVFTAPGLNREATHDWKYEYHFQGLKIR